MRAISSAHSAATSTREARGQGWAPAPQPWKPSLRIVLAYAATLCVWIAASDWAVAQMSSDPDTLTRLQTLKGWFFGVVSSLLLFLLIKRTIETIQDTAAHAARSDELHATIFERSPLGIFVVDDGGNYVQVNQAFADLLGYPRERLLQMNYRDVTHPVDLELTDGLYVSLRADADTFVAVEKRYVRADGSVRWAHLTATTLRTQAPRYGLGIARDITLRRQRDEELRATLDALRASQGQRRELVAALMRAEEEERQRIAADIHDDTLQVMTAVLMSLDLAEAEDVPERRDATVRAASETLRHAVQGLRHLVFGLSPAVLERKGLAAALKLHLEQAVERGRPFSWEVNYEAPGELPEQTRLLAYRTAREALVNSVKHAGAQRIKVDVHPDGDGIRFLIEDDGSGFEPDVATQVATGLGLGLMRERVELFGGTFEIRSSPGTGTVVDFWLPNTARSVLPTGQMTLEDAPSVSGT